MEFVEKWFIIKMKIVTFGLALLGIPMLSFAKALTAYFLPSLFASTK